MSFKLVIFLCKGLLRLLFRGTKSLIIFLVSNPYAVLQLIFILVNFCSLLFCVLNFIESIEELLHILISAMRFLHKHISYITTIKFLKCSEANY